MSSTPPAARTTIYQNEHRAEYEIDAIALEVFVQRYRALFLRLIKEMPEYSDAWIIHYMCTADLTFKTMAEKQPALVRVLCSRSSEAEENLRLIIAARRQVQEQGGNCEDQYEATADTTVRRHRTMCARFAGVDLDVSDEELRNPPPPFA